IISLVKASLSLRDLKKRPPAAQLREWISTFGKSIAMDAAFLVEMLEGGGAFVGSHRAVKRALQNGFPMGIGDLAIGGAELQDLGLKGPEVGVTLRHLHRWVLERPARNKKRALLAYTHTLSTGKKPSVN
ncbi:hypothetical protein KAI87_09950, partial [Myxococcota bacterium]|nr:hypothetical protein [Myxococcota bacterium]